MGRSASVLSPLALNEARTGYPALAKAVPVGRLESGSMTGLRPYAPTYRASTFFAYAINRLAARMTSG